jgi:4-amino-4-deoxy-L-arabinose transferase-like glycosyltransferase
MIQRIQSIYLLIVIALSAVLPFVFKLWEGLKKDVYALDLFSESPFLAKLVPVFFFITALIALIAIFKFKNRKLQFVLGRIIILINLFLLGILMYLSLTIPGEVSSEKGIGMFIPIVVVLFAVLANKAIKNDEDLVKSVDRLR